MKQLKDNIFNFKVNLFNKIALIHEYRMTHPAYEWRGDKLVD